MRASSTASFRKQKTCPSAETLLRYGGAGLARRRGRRVAEHLAHCDFCGAELQLLNRHAPRASAARRPLVEIPPVLRRLAEDLLAEPSFNRARFADSICEIERLSLTDA